MLSEMEILFVSVLLVAFIILGIVCLKSGNTESYSGKYIKLKTEDMDSIPDDELENAVVEWLFSKLDSKGTTEVPIMRAMPAPCRYIYASYIVTGEVMSKGFGECFLYVDSYLLSSAVEGFIDMGANRLAEILEKACDIAGEYIAEKGRKNMEGLSDNPELEQLSDEFVNSEDIVKLPDAVISYIKQNKDYFGD